MNYIYNILYTPKPPLTNADKKQDEEDEWYNDYVDWCQYDDANNQCVGYKSLISEASITIRLFNMFNEFLSNNSNVIIKVATKATYSFLSKANNVTHVYYLKEDAAKLFITEILKDDWSNYILLNKPIYNKHRIFNQDKVPYVVLDAFVYGFSRYDDLMKVASFDEHPIADMPIKPKDEPLQQNSYVKAHRYTVQSNAYNAKTHTFDEYLLQTPIAKKSFVKKFQGKIQKYVNHLGDRKNQSSVTNTKKTKESQPQLQNSFVFYANDPNALLLNTGDYNKRFIDTSTYTKGYDGIIKDEDLDGGKKKKHKPKHSIKKQTAKKTELSTKQCKLSQHSCNKVQQKQKKQKDNKSTGKKKLSD